MTELSGEGPLLPIEMLQEPMRRGFGFIAFSLAYIRLGPLSSIALPLSCAIKIKNLLLSPLHKKRMSFVPRRYSLVLFNILLTEKKGDVGGER